MKTLRLVAACAALTMGAFTAHANPPIITTIKAVDSSNMPEWFIVQMASNAICAHGVMAEGPEKNKAAFALSLAALLAPKGVSVYYSSKRDDGMCQITNIVIW